jgi:hypothetical protein
MTALKVIFGVITLACIVGFIWMLVIGLWQAAIPLAGLSVIFGYMTVRDIIKAVRKT